MDEHIKDLFAVLKATDSFKEKWGYNPHDNYAWREVLAFDYLKESFPTILKTAGRYGADGSCSELGMTYIEMKTVKTAKKKKTDDYSFMRLPFEFDMSKSQDKLDLADGFIFAVFDSKTSSYPINLLFVNERSKISGLKEVIRDKQRQFVKGTGRDTVTIEYGEILPFAESFGDYSPSTLLEFFV